jgi:hypothetical protein
LLLMIFFIKGLFLLLENYKFQPFFINHANQGLANSKKNRRSLN